MNLITAMMKRGYWIRETLPELVKYIDLGFLVCSLTVIVMIHICTWEAMQKFWILAIEKFLPISYQHYRIFPY